ncbi:MAG: OmpA family protein [Prevotellaceae bacterium]|jgi:outer membrane protein OmpA-like peptidoglycan-associated protein|nr:OmpA family protein [Prevotellaceae bacterium]
MKKIFIVLFLSTFILNTFAARPPKVKIEKVDPDTTQMVQYRTRANHWSISATAGAGYLDGDQANRKSKVIGPATWSVFNFNFTANLEYTFSPIWGMYLEYFYNPYSGTARYQNELAYPNREYVTSDAFDYKGMNHELILGASFNVLNIFYHCRPQKWQLYANVGIAGNLYKMTKHTSIDGNWADGYFLGDGDVLGTIPGDITLGKKFKSYDYTMSAPVGLSVEWNATRWLGVLANFQYHIRLNKDNFDGTIEGNDNDGAIYAGIGLRWKFNSLSHRNYYHVRDMAMCQYEQNMAMPAVKKLGAKVDSLDNKVDSLDKKVNDLEPRIKALEEDMENLRDTDGDGVPDVRDRHPNTPPGTVVDYWGVPVDGAARRIPDNTYHDGDSSNPIADPCDVNGNGIPNGKIIEKNISYLKNSTGKPDNKYIDGNPKKPIKNPYDVNGNGIPDYKEYGDNDDMDGDGIPNIEDPDIDGDGIPNEQDPTPYGAGSYRTSTGKVIVIEYDDDIDGDGISNESDPDIDGDGLMNEEDPTPWGKICGLSKNLMPDYADNMYHNGDKTKPIKDPNDVNGDGIPNWKQTGPNDDLDGDGIPNRLDNDIDGDGIPNAIDPTPYGAPCNDARTPSGTTTKQSGTYGSSGYGIEDFGASVYFSTSKSDLTIVSHNVLAGIARKMYANPDAKLEIHAYCDEQGQRSQYDNIKLSKNRAKIVRETLIKKYGVKANRIVVCEGHGAIQGPTIDYLPNRRADLIVIK